MIPVEKDSIIYVPNHAIRRLNIGFSEIVALVERTFGALNDGSVESIPKVGMDVSRGQFFHAMVAGDFEEGLAGMKWVGVAQEIHGLVVLSDLATSAPVAVVDGTWITSVRPAAVTVVAAKILANPASRRVGFVACGQQAQRHLDALRQYFPISEVTCFSRTRRSAELFATHAEQRGLEASVANSSGDALDTCDIVVTSVPRGSAPLRDLDPALLKSGCFVSGVDLARTWDERKIDRFELVVTDDLRQSRELCGPGLIPWRDRFDADLGSIVAGARHAEFNSKRTVMFVHPGIGICDLVIAAEIVKRAAAAGYAIRVPR